jgi:hypothetical protein
MDAHRAELQAERDRNAREMAAMNERAARDLEIARREREQAIQLHDRMHQTEIQTITTAHSQLIATKDAEIARLNESLRDVRAIKDRDVVEELERLNRIKQAASNIVEEKPALDEDKDKDFGWLDLVKHAGPLFEHLGHGIAKRVAPQTAPAPAPAPAESHTPVTHPPSQPRRPHASGVGSPFAPRRGFVQQPRERMPAQAPFQAVPSGFAQGRREPMRQPAPVHSAPPPMRSRPTAPVASTPTESLAATEAPATSDELQHGLDQLETAFRARQSADTVAQAIQSALPKDLVSRLITLGAARILEEIERRNSNSLLATIGGRRFIADLLSKLGSSAAS